MSEHAGISRGTALKLLRQQQTHQYQLIGKCVQQNLQYYKALHKTSSSKIIVMNISTFRFFPTPHLVYFFFHHGDIVFHFRGIYAYNLRERYSFMIMYLQCSDFEEQNMTIGHTKTDKLNWTMDVKGINFHKEVICFMGNSPCGNMTEFCLFGTFT